MNTADLPAPLRRKSSPPASPRRRRWIAGVALLLGATALARAGDYTSVDIGEPAPPAGRTDEIVAGRDFDLTGYGRMFMNHLASDEGRFVYRKVKGDFDVVVQVAAVSSPIAAYVEAGLMARESLDPRSRAAAQFVTGNDFKHGADQYTFDYRLKEGGSLFPSATRFVYDFHGTGVHGNPTIAYAGRMWLNDNPSRPRPFPEVWLRLRRVGDTFSGYWREKEDFWHKVAECRMDLGAEVYVGLCLNANHHDPEVHGKLGDPKQPSTARFRGLEWRTEFNALEYQPIKTAP